MARERPSHMDSLAESLAEAWRLLARGVVDRRFGFHHPVIATTGLDGRPRARVVVLRGVEPATRTVRFHTDGRSEKVAELARDPRVAILAYASDAKVQLRLEGLATVHHTTAVAESAWDGSRPQSRVCYGTEPAPGTVIAGPDAFTLPAKAPDATTAPGRDNFRAVTVAVASLEWLFLAHGGHRRALFRWNAEGVEEARWLVP